MAFGPHYSSGISANGAYKLYRDLRNNMIFVQRDSIEYLNEDGSVMGNKNKSYTIQFLPA